MAADESLIALPIFLSLWGLQRPDRKVFFCFKVTQLEWFNMMSFGTSTLFCFHGHRPVHNTLTHGEERESAATYIIPTLAAMARGTMDASGAHC